MKNSTFILGAAIVLSTLAPSFAQAYDARGDNPSTTYYICNHQAHYTVNDRAKLITPGAPNWVDNGDGTVTLGRTQDIYLQTQRLVTPAWRSLSTDSRFCQN